MDRATLLSRLARTRSRGQVKALGAEADADPALRAALEALAAERGVERPGSLSGKTLVRRALARSADARRRRNPIHRDEAFTCAWCGAAVDPGGARVRDHCPACLRGRHVDVVPGDRAADCGALLQPIALERQGDTVSIRYRCEGCGHEHRCRAHPDDAIPPSLSVGDLPDRGSRRVHGRARTLPRRVLSYVRRHRLWEPGQTVLVAVSGGLDSTVLLELLWRTRAAHGGRLRVCTIDHGLRPESAQEVAGVLEHCETLGVPATPLRLELDAGPNLQARARAARRAALVAAGADRIATGHHADDQAETVLQRLMTGSGATGLRGMQPLDAPWCRPLLEIERAELRAWADAEGLRWVDDPSNPTSQRGRLRALLDGMDELRAGACRGLARSARLLARDDALLDDLLDEAWTGLVSGGEPDAALRGACGPHPGGLGAESLDVGALGRLHPALQLRALRRLTGGRGRADQLERVVGATLGDGWSLPLGEGIRLRVRGGRLGVETVEGDDGEERG